MIPLWLDPNAGLFGDDEEAGRDGEHAGPVANLNPKARAHLEKLGLLGSDPDAVFYHTLAVLHAPAYQAEHVGALRQDWPRIPLPDDSALLLRSAALGRRLAALLDVGVDVDGVTTGRLRPALNAVARLRHRLGAEVSRASGHFALNATWGRPGRPGVVMPGPGRAEERDFSDEEVDAMGDAAQKLGPGTYDVHLNDDVVWANVPDRVWDYTLGGYQVLKKWLSYRERPVLGRDLTLDEVRHVQESARRIAAILLLEPDLDESYSSMIVMGPDVVTEPYTPYTGSGPSPIQLPRSVG